MELTQGIDLDVLLQEFTNCQAMYNEMFKEKSKLAKQLEVGQHMLDESKQRESQLQQTIQTLHELVKSSQKLLAAQCNFEDENLKLKDELKAAELKQQELIAEHEAESRAVQSGIEDMKQRHEAELDCQRVMLTERFTVEIEAMKQTVAEQTAASEKLESRVDQMERDHQMELVQLRVEYENKIQRLQKQLMSSTAASGSNQMSLANQEIFRRKLQHLREESEREVTSLRRTISELQQQLQAASQQSRTHHSYLSTAKRLNRP